MMHVSGTATHYFIGLNDKDTSRGWLWTDGSPFVYLNWAESLNICHHNDYKNVDISKNKTNKNNDEVVVIIVVVV